MEDSTFSNLDLVAWYKDGIDNFIDPFQIGYKYLRLKPGRTTTHGTSFTKKRIDTNL